MTDQTTRQIGLQAIGAASHLSLLAKIPHHEMEGIAIVPWYIPDRKTADTLYGQSPQYVTCEDLFLMGIDTATLMERAMQTTVRTFTPYVRTLASQLGEMIAGNEEDFPPVLVLTNEQSYYGAMCMFYPNLMARLADLVQDDLYIVPSSVHEVLLLPKGAVGNYAGLKRAVYDINRSDAIEPEDVLTDDIYCYYRGRDCIHVVQEA